MNLSIRITESNEGFAAFTVVSPIHTGNNSTIIHIGHVDEVHYVSTVVSDHNNSSTNIDSDTPRNDYNLMIIEYLNMVFQTITTYMFL